MAFPTTVIVEFAWDPEANVYVATSDDVPGLVAEAKTVEKLDEKVRYLIPLLLEENKHLFNDELDMSVPIELLIQQRSILSLNAG